MGSHSRTNIQEAPTHLHHIEAEISPVLSALDEGAGRFCMHLQTLLGGLSGSGAHTLSLARGLGCCSQFFPLGLLPSSIRVHELRVQRWLLLPPGILARSVLPDLLVPSAASPQHRRRVVVTPVVSSSSLAKKDGPVCPLPSFIGSLIFSPLFFRKKDPQKPVGWRSVWLLHHGS